MMRESEDAREELQQRLIQYAADLKEDTLLKEKYQNSLLEEIAQLNAEIQDLKRQMSA